MKKETSPFMNSLIQFFVFVSLQYSTVINKCQRSSSNISLHVHWRKKVLNIGGGAGGKQGKPWYCPVYWVYEGGTMHFKIFGRGRPLLPFPPPPHSRSYAYVLLVVSADKCHIHMCAIFFMSITESISSDYYHFHVDRSTKLE